MTTKYIKKDEFKNIKHILTTDDGRIVIIEDNVMESEELFNRYQYMFEVLDESPKPEPEPINEMTVFGNPLFFQTKPSIDPVAFEPVVEEVTEEVVEASKKRGGRSKK